MAANSPYLTVEEVAGLFRVHPITIYRLLRDGKLAALKLGRIWRFDRREMEAAFSAPGADKQRQKSRKR